MVPTEHLRVSDQRLRLENKIQGTVIDRGLDNELNDTPYILVSTSDGFNHYQVLSKFSEPKDSPISLGQVVEIRPDRRNDKTDDTILRFTMNGDFNLDNFSKIVSSERAKGKWKIPKEVSTEEYLKRYEQRLESLERIGIVKTEDNKTYQIPESFQKKVKTIEDSIGAKHYVKVKALSPYTLQNQVIKKEHTWLDTQAQSGAKANTKTAYGKTLENALEKRKEFLTKYKDLSQLVSKIKAIRKVE